MLARYLIKFKEKQGRGWPFRWNHLKIFQIRIDVSERILYKTTNVYKPFQGWYCDQLQVQIFTKLQYNIMINLFVKD